MLGLCLLQGLRWLINSLSTGGVHISIKAVMGADVRLLPCSVSAAHPLQAQAVEAGLEKQRALFF